MSTDGVQRNNLFFAPEVNDSINFLCEVGANMRSALFWDITQRIVVIPYRYFRITNQYILQVSRNPNLLALGDGSDRFPEMSVRGTVSNIPEDCRSHPLRGRSLILRIVPTHYTYSK
jgi:hypothetical protein